MTEVEGWVVIALIGAYVALKVLDAKAQGASEAGEAAGRGAVMQLREELERLPGVRF